MNHAPKISIITINYNNDTGLKKTIESVARQTYSDFEYIIIDGGSTDGSVQVINNYTAQITYSISEKDNGIYHAMNKGIARAVGDYLLFLNSGDFLVSDEVLSQTAPFFNASFDLLYGCSVMKKGDKEYIREPAEKMRFSDFVMRRGPHHQSTFIKRYLFDEIGLYNETNKILADWEFFLKAIFKYEKQIKYLPFKVACFDLTGISSDKQNSQLLKSEKAKIIRENYPRFEEDYKELVLYKNLLGNSRMVKAYLKYVRRLKL